MVDNLSDALIMAGAVLIFVLALTVSMSSFTVMRTQIDEIIEIDSRIDLAQDESTGEYFNYMSTSSDVRVVGIETIVSSMYRVAKENYVIYIKTNDHNYGSAETIELKDEGLPAQYYGNDSDPIIRDDEEIIQIRINGINSDASTLLDEKGLYNTLKGKKFKEYLGVYQEESGANEANRTTYRVITYVEEV